MSTKEKRRKISIVSMICIMRSSPALEYASDSLISFQHHGDAPRAGPGNKLDSFYKDVEYTPILNVVSDKGPV